MQNIISYITVNAKAGFRKFMKDEKGDTNFISILIILGVVIALAGVFIGFKDSIVSEVQGIVDGFTLSGGGNESELPTGNN